MTIPGSLTKSLSTEGIISAGDIKATNLLDSLRCQDLLNDICVIFWRLLEIEVKKKENHWHHRIQEIILLRTTTTDTTASEVHLEYQGLPPVRPQND